MDDANVSGTSVVDVVAGLNGTSSGSGITSAAGPISGLNARQTNGSSFISLASAPMPALNGAFSLGFFQFIPDISIPSQGTNPVFMGLKDTSGRGLRIGNAFDETLGGAVCIVNSNAIDFTTAKVYSNGVWAHVCVTTTGTQSGTTFYVNAVPITKGVADGAPTTAANNIFFGLDSTGPDRLVPSGGRLYQVVIYNRALTATEVTQLFNAENPTGNSGTGAVAQAAQTVSGAGTLALQGAGTVAQAAQTVAAAGTLALQGAGTVAQEAQTVSAAGSLTVQGAGTVAQAAQTVAATGTFSLVGTGSVAQAAQTATAAGAIVLDGAGTVSQLAQTVSATGSVPAGAPVTGIGTVAQVAQTVSAAGIAQPAIATGAVAQEAQTVHAAGTAGKVQMSGSNQSLLQASVRALTGTALSYQGDFHALFDQAAIPAGTFNGRLTLWIEQQLAATFSGVMEAKQAYAVAAGVNDWDELSALIGH